jgi:hypothetical protein
MLGLADPFVRPAVINVIFPVVHPMLLDFVLIEVPRDGLAATAATR